MINFLNTFLWVNEFDPMSGDVIEQIGSACPNRSVLIIQIRHVYVITMRQSGAVTNNRQLADQWIGISCSSNSQLICHNV